jgi:hypothetical protein
LAVVIAPTMGGVAIPRELRGGKRVTRKIPQKAIRGVSISGRRFVCVKPPV